MGCKEDELEPAFQPRVVFVGGNEDDVEDEGFDGDKDKKEDIIEEINRFRQIPVSTAVAVTSRHSLLPSNRRRTCFLFEHEVLPEGLGTQLV